MTCAHCRDAPDVFSRRLARWELWWYRRGGPSRTTRLLLDSLLQEGVEGRTLLDVGGGVGAVQHEFLAAGAARAVNVDAAPAYQEAAREEAERRGTADRVDFYLGDFVEVAPAIPPADVVSLDRVICCYPDAGALVEASAVRARRLWGAVLPRERLAVRVMTRTVNLLQRLRGSAFRVYLHPTAAVEAVLEDRGFTRHSHRTTALWQVMVWRRES